MRFGDYSRLTKYDITDGLIRLKQAKTSNNVVIPVHPRLCEIINRWDGAPKVSQQKFNLIIKIICRLADITEMVAIGWEKTTRYEEKCELVSSHTARRSAAINMFKAGIPTISIMKITGHKTESNFMKYIKISKEEYARLLVDNEFFK